VDSHELDRGEWIFGFVRICAWLVVVAGVVFCD
jgi:hypothetical protein